PITISIGFAHNHAGAAVSKAERLVAAADQALYAAKRLGRNRAELATSPGRYSAGTPDEEQVLHVHQMNAQEPPSKLRRRFWEQTTAPADHERHPHKASKPLPPPNKPRRG